MSSKSGTVCLNSGTVLSVFCLLLYSAGFIRIELKFNDHEARLMAVEDVISQMHSRKQRFMMDDTSIKGTVEPVSLPVHYNTPRNVTMKDFKKKEDNSKMVLHRFTRQVTSNKPFENSTKIRLILEDVVTSSFKKMCQNTGTWNVCPRGLPGPPGSNGPKGDKGNRGRRGKKGMMGQPGRSGKQGIMGPPGIRGEKGLKGDIGAPGIPGMKGEPGESISSPKVTVSSSHLTVNESNTAVLLCSVSGNPVPQVAWSRVRGVLPSNRTKVSSEGLLQINEVRLEDAGNYKCVARNILGREEKLASLAVQSQPKTSLSFGPSYVVKGKNITLPACHVTGYPSPKISWHKVPGNLVQARTVMKDGRLSIMNAHKSDSGLYKCEASNSLGHDSAVTQLNVVELPHFTVSPPLQLKVSTVQNITVPCQATGDPQPTIMWRKEGSKLPAGRSSVSADGTLKIWNLREREDSGRYTCVASSNQFFMAFSVMDVIVQHKGPCLPVKVEDRSAILDARITASSYYGFGGSDPYYPYFGRLNENRGRGGWCPKTSSISEYLQIDMGSDRFVCGVATQQAKENQLTTSYKIRFSSNGATWKTYKENKSEKVFVGKRGILQHSLSTTVKARFVRFYPVAYSSWPCLRVEIFAVR